jgi:phosphoglycolate phosphatase-like HAD superfamily hydrolase
VLHNNAYCSKIPKKENIHIYLDFDGVLFDTAREAYAVLYFIGERVTAIENVSFGSQQHEIFCKLRPYVGPAWNYFYVKKEMVRTDDSRNVVNCFLKSITEAFPAEYQEFENEFFATRTAIQKKFKEEWFNLNKPYPFLFLIAPFLCMPDAPFSIVTTKDSKTVDILLKKTGISFREENIFDKKSFAKLKSKSFIIDNHMQKNNITKALLIDDSARHIQECLWIKNLDTVIPDWGYIIDPTISHTQKAVLDRIHNLTEG